MVFSKLAILIDVIDRTAKVGVFAVETSGNDPDDEGRLFLNLRSLTPTAKFLVVTPDDVVNILNAFKNVKALGIREHGVLGD